MTTPAALPRIDVLHPGAAPAVLELDSWAFPLDQVELDPSYALDGFEWDRTLGAHLPDPASGRDRLAGTCTTYSRRLVVPGGADVPVAALSWVGVHPDFRRRGVLTALMGRQLDDVRAAGREPLGALFASEPAIYGRFGYGLATRSLRMALARGAALRDVAGSDDVALTSATLSEAEHAASVAECRRLAWAQRPGAVSAAPHQARELFADPPRHRVGREAKRLLVAAGPGHDPSGGGWAGFAVYRRAPEWAPTGPAGRVEVHELVAHDAPTARALWGRLVDLDLMASLDTGSRPLDDPLLHLLVDPRAAAPRVQDGMFVRVVDVAAALVARRYRSEVDLVLDVADAFRPDWGGRWRLTARPGAAPSCATSTDEPDLALEVRELGAAYLGGESWSALVAAGLVDERRPGAADEADRAFGSALAPFPAVPF